MRLNVRLLAGLPAVLALMLFTAPAGAVETATLFGSTGTGSGPTDIAIDSTGTIFTANGGNGTVSKITPTGTVTAAWATTIVSPTRVDIGPNDAVYSSGDTGASCGQNFCGYIQKWSADGTSSTDYSTGFGVYPRETAVDANGNMFFFESALGRIAAGGGTPTTVSAGQGYQFDALAVDPSGNVFVARLAQQAQTTTIEKYTNTLSGSPTSYSLGSGRVDDLAADATYLYITDSSAGAVHRLTIASGALDLNWATNSQGPRYIAIGPDGSVYVTTGGFGPSGAGVSKIAADGSMTPFGVTGFPPTGIAIDAQSNVFVTSSGFGGGEEGVYKIAGAAPAPDPTPAPGPKMKTGSIPNAIRVANTKTPAVKVPCEAADGELLSECTVQITAPRSVLAGLGGGIEVTNARATKNVTLGLAKVTPKTPRKRIVVTVRLNANGKKAMRRNVRVRGLIDLTAITQASSESSGRKRVRLQLPRQTMTPTKGIFDTLSTTLNKDGVAFVKRLAKVLPKKPKRIVCTGYADGYGVPGDNRWLGEQRAKTLCDELRKRGIKPRTTRLVSRGADDPRASNTTPDGRAKNRRASITITY